jgi:hypothetical protein
VILAEVAVKACCDLATLRVASEMATGGPHVASKKATCGPYVASKKTTHGPHVASKKTIS